MIVPESVTSIRSNAFAQCSNLKNVTILGPISEFGGFIFSGCDNLELVNFQNYPICVNSINIFSYTNFLKLTLSFTCKTLFSYKSLDRAIKVKISYLQIPDLIIGENSLIMNNIKTEIYEFWGYNYNNITIPKSVITIRESVFENSTLTSIIFEEDSNLTSIYSFAFRNCSNLVTIELPESVKNIHESAFLGCQLLKNLTFLGPIENIEDNMFINCNNLEFVIFPKSSMIVNCNSFCTNNCPKFMSFTHKTLFSLGSIDIITNVLISYFDEENLIITKNSIIMNSNQTEIYEFWGYNYDNITIPKSVITIRENAFENSTLRNIIFEEDSNLCSIYSSAFRNCKFLTKLDFSSLKLSIIDIFCFKNCFNLISVCLPFSNLIILSDAFENCINLVNLTNMTNIPNECFSGCTNLSSVSIMEGTTYIGVRSFENCISLESIIIPSSVEKISEYAFINCNNLKSITFSETNSLSNISINSISGCESLKNISNFISNNHKYKCIDNTIYYQNNTKLDLIYHLSHSIDDVLIINCDVICQYSFNHSNNIVNISLSSDSVSHIESYSFNDCKNLKYINFPLSVESVSTFAFHECKSIRCPLLIENTTINYLKMINESGIPPKLIISYRVVHGSNKVQVIKRIYNKTHGIFWHHLSK